MSDKKILDYIFDIILGAIGVLIALLFREYIYKKPRTTPTTEASNIQKIVDDSKNCRLCQNFIDSDTNPTYHFLKLSWPFLAIIGLFGTMLALMPNFFEKVGNSSWLGSLNFNGIILLFSAILVLFFMMIQFFLFTIEITNQKYGSIIALMIFPFLIFLFGVIFYIYFTVSTYLVTTFAVNYILVFYVIPISLFVLIVLMQNLLKLNKKQFSFDYKLVLNRKNLLIMLILIGCILFWMGLAYWFDSYQNNYNSFLIEEFQRNVSIESDSHYYNHNIPSSIGLSIYPSAISGMNSQLLNSYIFYWNVNYGYFIKWIPNEQRIIYLSNLTVQNGEQVNERIMWTYSTNDNGKMKENVTIGLKIRNISGSYIANRTMNISWIDNDTAKII
jgi:hypothetical protein